MSAVFRGTVNIWPHYIRFRADSDIRLLSFIIQSALKSRILFVTRLANKQHYINQPNLDFNAFHIPADVKLEIQRAGIPKHRQTQTAHRGAQACLDFGRSWWTPNLHRNWTSFVLCSQLYPSGPLLPHAWVSATSWSGSSPIRTKLLSRDCRAFQTKLSSWLLHQESLPACFGYSVLLPVILYALDFVPDNSQPDPYPSQNPWFFS